MHAPVPNASGIEYWTSVSIEFLLFWSRTSWYRILTSPKTNTQSIPRCSRLKQSKLNAHQTSTLNTKYSIPILVWVLADPKLDAFYPSSYRNFGRVLVDLLYSNRRPIFIRLSWQNDVHLTRENSQVEVLRCSNERTSESSQFFCK